MWRSPAGKYAGRGFTGRGVPCNQFGGQEPGIRWNFEKFLIGTSGEVVARFGPHIKPEDDKVVAAIEGALPA